MTDYPKIEGYFEKTKDILLDWDKNKCTNMITYRD